MNRSENRNEALRNLLIAGLLLVVIGCSNSERPKVEQDPVSKKVASANVVKATFEPVEISAGGSAEATVLITIEKGFHLNANPPTYSYLKATELEIPPANSVSVGFITYPDPITQKFEFAEEPLAVYEGETRLKVLLQATKSAPKGPLNLEGELRVQACDDQVCYPPGALNVTLPVIIK
jgi:thiol:disulfide interchange protein DsbD